MWMLRSLRDSCTNFSCRLMRQAIPDSVTKNVNVFIKTLKPFCTALFTHKSELYERMKGNIRENKNLIIGQIYGLLSSYLLSQTEAVFFQTANSVGGYYFSSLYTNKQGRIETALGINEASLMEVFSSSPLASCLLISHAFFAKHSFATEGIFQKMSQTAERVGWLALALHFAGPVGGSLGALCFPVIKSTTEEICHLFHTTFEKEKVISTLRS